jgi:hypothetical protein
MQSPTVPNYISVELDSNGGAAGPQSKKGGLILGSVKVKQPTKKSRERERKAAAGKCARRALNAERGLARGYSVRYTNNVYLHRDR